MKSNKLSIQDLSVIEASKRLNDGRWLAPAYCSLMKIKARLGTWLILGVSAFSKTHIFGFEKYLQAAKSGQPIVIVAWHGSLMIPIYCFRKRSLVIMTSLSEDGDTLTQILYNMGFKCVRGSSSRGGMRGLLEMIKIVNSGANAALTVDGPQGPRKVVKPGAAMLAKRTGALLVPLGMGYSNVMRLKNWDKTEIPMPKSTSALVLGSPFKISDKVSIHDGCNLIKEKILHSEYRAAKFIETGVLPAEKKD